MRLPVPDAAAPCMRLRMQSGKFRDAGMTRDATWEVLQKRATSARTQVLRCLPCPVTLHLARFRRRLARRPRFDAANPSSQAAH